MLIDVHTEVKELIPCEDIPSLIIKRIEMNNTNYYTPLRTIYISSEIPGDIIKRIEENRNFIFEINRVIYLDKQYNAIKTAFSENIDERIKHQLRVNDTIERKNLIISFSFSEFPDLKLGKNIFGDFLDAIYEYSSIVFVPHVRYSKTLSTATTYSAESYLKYIDKSLRILSERNSKPIFVPLDVDFPVETRNKILGYYAKLGLTNIWIDLKGKTFNKSLSRKIRSIYRVSKEIYGTNAKNLVFYLTNIRKIPREQKNIEKIPPSDFLCFFNYSDFVGASFKGIQRFNKDDNYWERKGFKSEEEYKRYLLRRESSLFESTSYYYVAPEYIKFNNQTFESIKEITLCYINKQSYIASKISNMINGFLTLDEIKTIRKKVLNEYRIANYLKEKDFFKKEGKSLLEELHPIKEKSLFDFEL